MIKVFFISIKVYINILFYILIIYYVIRNTQGEYVVEENITREMKLAKGISLFKNGKYEEAVLYLQDFTKKNQDFSLGWFYLGLCLSSLGRYKESIDAFDRAIGLDENDWISISARGVAKFGNKDLKGAKLDFTKSISIYPNDVPTLVFDAICDIALNDSSSAEQKIKQAFEINPEICVMVYTSFMKSFSDLSNLSKEQKENLEKTRQEILKSFSEFKAMQETIKKK